MPSPATVRSVGLAGSLSLAAAAYLGGSGFTRGLSVKPDTILQQDNGPALVLCWLAGIGLLIVAWLLGRDVVPSTGWALVTAGLWMLPLLPFLPLGSEDIYSYACQGYVQYAGGDPYAAGVQQWGCPWVDSVAVIWRTSPAPYGPLFLMLAGLAVHVGGSLIGTLAGLRVIALVGLALTAAGLPVLARRAGVRPARAVWLLVACPLVQVHLVSGAHNDALMIGLLVAALAVVASRPVPAGLLVGGALLGLAVAVKATAVVVLPFAVLAAVPAGTALRGLWRPGAWAGAGAVGAMALMSLVSGRGVGWVWGLARSGDTVQWTSPSTALGITIDNVVGWAGPDIDAVGVTRTVGVLLLGAVLVVLWWRARFGDALLGAGLALAATVVLAPVVHPWYATWPLAVLAATWAGPPQTLTRWLLAPCAVAALLTLPAGYNVALVTRSQGSYLMTLAMLVLGGLAVRRQLRARSREAPIEAR